MRMQKTVQSVRGDVICRSPTASVGLNTQKPGAFRGNRRMAMYSPPVFALKRESSNLL